MRRPQRGKSVATAVFHGESRQISTIVKGERAIGALPFCDSHPTYALGLGHGAIYRRYICLLV